MLGSQERTSEQQAQSLEEERRRSDELARSNAITSQALRESNARNAELTERQIADNAAYADMVERARIQVNAVTFANPSAGFSAVGRISLQNSGGRIPQDVRISQIVQVVGAEEQIPTAPECTQSYSVGPFSSLPQPIWTRNRLVSPEEASSYASGGAAILATGRICYDDGDSRRRETEFCYYQFIGRDLVSCPRAGRVD